uniref:Uncharacterized protein n=1 Tax=Candidatus Kentrum sp. LFY TaxID=2126342 RepID=A0A450UMD1_9GAMM|nr:MAG: hypothetical protein BECKLFY1418B_GA0070995_10497 [Candidatus Kentron sp. LFY]VFJ93703.1 MAG: hypothetical protein BECKLFY1418A_GA0070994_103327 [Candidatus Kentron sp. LFY]
MLSRDGLAGTVFIAQQDDFALAQFEIQSIQDDLAPKAFFSPLACKGIALSIGYRLSSLFQYAILPRQ